ncbi:hypothetical protein AVEN_53227-1 [Araneus ventricosus]|uniref:Uncharacterized protein n=1 Tax=Araneus ventricosus TaxID=182803 RepID=A0A4Y2A9V0_ARAVE|nr:hypothetical protein AVEN_53227-1 [Araneus ventricosus]
MIMHNNEPDAYKKSFKGIASYLKKVCADANKKDKCTGITQNMDCLFGYLDQLKQQASCIVHEVCGNLKRTECHSRSLHSTRKWRGGALHHSVFQPIHLGRSFTVRFTQTTNTSSTGTLTPYANSSLLRFLLERESFAPPQISAPFSFQYFWTGSPNGAFGYPDRLKIPNFYRAAPILIGFSH